MRDGLGNKRSGRNRRPRASYKNVPHFAKAARGAVTGSTNAGWAKLAWIAIAIFSVGCTAVAQQTATQTHRKSGRHATQLSIVAANVQMLLIAPDGKETGFDPVAKKKRHAIADSGYYEDALLAYDSGRVDPNTTQTIDVNHPAAGTYRLVISQGTAADGEEYEVQIHLYSPDGGNLKTARIAGIAKSGKVATYELIVRGDPGTIAVIDARKRR